MASTVYCDNGRDLLGRGPPLKSVMNDFTMFLYCTYDLHDPVTSCVTVSFFLFLRLLLHCVAVRNALKKKIAELGIAFAIAFLCRKKSASILVAIRYSILIHCSFLSLA